MEQYSSTCPHCNFVLQFYDPSLFGRRGRCPKCRNKFVIEKRDPNEADSVDIAVQPAPRLAESGSIAAKRAEAPSSAKAPQAESPVPQIVEPVRRAAPAASAEKEQPWEMDATRGLGGRKPTLSPRWVFPNVLALSTVSVIAVGAAIGMGAVALLADSASPSMLAMASAVGGAVAAGFLVRRYDPLGPKS